jgi:hypothetical protein
MRGGVEEGRGVVEEGGGNLVEGEGDGDDVIVDGEVVERLSGIMLEVSEEMQVSLASSTVKTMFETYPS